jgi:hypothetical protein
MTGSMTGSMTDSAARASLGQVLDACRQLARETLAFLEIRQDAAQKKPHQEDVGSNDPRNNGLIEIISQPRKCTKSFVPITRPTVTPTRSRRRCRLLMAIFAFLGLIVPNHGC